MITTLRTLGPVLAKTWNADGTISNYDEAKQYTCKLVDVNSLNELHELLDKLQHDPRSCIIRGVPTPETLERMRKLGTAHARVLRRLEEFEDQPSRLFMVDVDNWDGTLQDYVDTLPSCFHDVSFVLQWSGSHGHPSKPGIRAHLWFWLEQPLTCAQAEAWSKQYLPQADSTVHRTVQVNYTANPIIRMGTDPCQIDGHPGRLAMMPGLLGTTVIIPSDMPVPEATAARAAGRAGRQALVDPRGKPGIIGAVCRAFPPQDIVMLFPDHFQEGRSPERITWLHGGGSPEGIGVSDTGTHLFCSHSTSPCGDRAQNLFDFIRTFVFGHLDEGGDYEMMPSASPSYKATEAWARELPEVQDQLNPHTPEAKQQVIDTIDSAKDKAAVAALDNEESSEQRLANIGKLIERADSLTKLENDVGRRVAKFPGLTPAQREVIAGQMQERSAALNRGKRLPIAIVRQWVAPVSLAGEASFPHLGADGEVLGTIENLEVLCQQHNLTIRYDVIRKRQEILGPGMAYARDNYENASFAKLISHASAARMPHNANQIKGYVCELAARNVYNPVLEWIESEPWDGVSRLSELMGTLTLRPGFDPDLARLMVRKWMIQAVAAAASPVPLQTRGVLVLQGEQYLGKSRWVTSLVPGHEELAILGRTINPHDRDSVKIAISHWIAELGELDATFKRSDIAALKAFLANPEDSFRLPYAPAESKFQRRTVFVASVNDEEFLRDDTGNTRFWVLPVVAMNHTHTVDMQQLWAEMLDAWQMHEPHWFERDEMQEVEKSNTRFTIKTAVEQLVAQRFPWDRALKQGVPEVPMGQGISLPASSGEAGRPNDDLVWVWRSNHDIAVLCGVQGINDTALVQVGKAVQKFSGLPSRSNGHLRLRLVPLPRAEVELGELTD